MWVGVVYAEYSHQGSWWSHGSSGGGLRSGNQNPRPFVCCLCYFDDFALISYIQFTVCWFNCTLFSICYKNSLTEYCCVVHCNISTAEARVISWASEVRYLGVFVVRSRSFKCAYDNAKRSFYSAVNGILGKVLNFASKDVILQLITPAR